MNSRALEIKRSLINAAASGAEHPPAGSRTGEALRRFVDPSSADFDPDFVDELRGIDAGWMVRSPSPGSSLSR